eukprot:13315303-Alexandrium_andersonii.AAC.1
MRSHPSRCAGGYAACQGCTTSGVERYFSIANLTLNLHRGAMLAHHELDEMLLRTVEHADVDAVLRGAQSIWLKLYGPVRKRLVQRCDA